MAHGKQLPRRTPGIDESAPAGPLHPITAAPTSVTAFIGGTPRGPVNHPVLVHGQADFELTFGGLWERGTLPHSVRAFFLNGGSDALIVRVGARTRAASCMLAGPDGKALMVTAHSDGAWGNDLRIAVEHDPNEATDTAPFGLFVNEVDPANGEIRSAEAHLNLSTDPESERYAPRVLEHGSRLVRIGFQGTPVPSMPTASRRDPDDGRAYIALDGGSDGGPLTAAQLTGGPGNDTAGLGLYALDGIGAFNLLVIESPEPDPGTAALIDAALAYCTRRRAMLLLDPPATWTGVGDVEAAADAGRIPRDANAVLYFPRVLMPDPLLRNRPAPLTPSGVMAGVIARTDATRGVWSAPAGIQTILAGVTGVEHPPTEAELGRIGPAGVNALRLLPGIGPVAWSARTTVSTQETDTEWKFLPVRRLALHLEQSILAGTAWAAAEPNDETLWSLLRLEVMAFLRDLFDRGAFKGTTPALAYFVNCGPGTTTPADVDRGEVNISVGFAPLKPSEFVVLSMTLPAGTAPEA